MDEFVNALLSARESSKIPEEYDWYAPLLGDWDFDYYDIQDGKRTRHVEGEWMFRRVLDGTAIEDLFICPSRETRDTNPQPDGEYGAAVRMFNSGIGGYDMVYTARGFMIRLEVHMEDGKIVCTVLDRKENKWVFDEITKQTFHWKNITVQENGVWKVNCEVLAVRKQSMELHDVYEHCPVIENETYQLRLTEERDAEDLLKVYSDKKAVPFFNSDNCGGDDFHYTTLVRMQEAVRYWLWEYRRRGFVRWTILDKNTDEAIGTIELFRRISEDSFSGCGVLRLDLRSDYEKRERIGEILRIIVPPAYGLFRCGHIVTKAVPDAGERIAAMLQMGFEPEDRKLIGHDGTAYGDYYRLSRYSSDRFLPPAGAQPLL